MSELQDQTGVDELLASIESPGAERAMSAPEGDAAPAEQQAPQQPTWNGEEWAFETGGKRVVPEGRDHLIKWASQGYNYSQRMGELNKTHAQKMAELEERAKQYQGYDRYKTVDEYARQNPQWWEHVEKSYQQRSVPQVDPSLQPVLDPILQKVQTLEAFVTEAQAEKQRVEYERQDQALDTEIGEIRKKFPNIDLSSVDPASGETLELRVLKHAGQLGTSSFRAAFLDYFGDKLFEMTKSQALEQAAKDKEAMAKKGILGKTPAPVKGLSTGNHRGKSYDDLLNEAKSELNIA